MPFSPQIRSKFSRFPWYVLLLAVYPVLALLAANLEQIEPWVALRPLAFALLAAVLLLAVLFLLTRDLPRAGLATGWLLLLFFSYGHLYQVFKAAPGVSHLLGQHRVLAVIFLVVGAGVLWLILKRLRQPAAWRPVLNSSTALLACLSLAQIGLAAARTPAVPAASVRTAGLNLQARPDAPDIYYIILDMYTRSDVLAHEYGFDNQPFLDELRSLGFQTALCASSNYASTELSLASSLNLDYLDRFGRDFRAGGEGNALLPGLIKEGRFRTALETLGYQSIAFETGYYWSQWMDADIYLTPPASAAFQQVRPFELLLLRSSAASVVLDAAARLQARWAVNADLPYSDHIRRERFVLDKLANLGGLAGRKLVFAHVLIPHNPQVFAPDGSIRQDPGFWSNGDRAVNDEYFREGYTGQVAYVNHRVIEIVRAILASSKTPPVIIIQGDHGVHDPYRHAILNSYYLPGQPAASVPDNLSPVNTFRLVLNRYFGANLSLLPDRSYDLDEATGQWIQVDTACGQTGD